MQPGERARFRGESIGFVFQGFNLLPTLTADDNVSVPLLIGGASRRQARQRAHEILGTVRLGERLGALPAQLKSTGATSRLLLGMIFVQTGVCAIVGTGLGLGLCGIAGPIVSAWGFPFRMMWFTPLLGSVMVLVVSLLAALISARPVLKLEPAAVFAGRA
jgi:predicted lysophospholipase L1 biosynthesis ABC-type transport system permease subunit